jgi:glycerol-3-phosphate acyltransferase PlsX
VKRIKVAVDAMGGDNAPREIVRGAVAALELPAQPELTFFGDEEIVRTELGQTDCNSDRVKVVHTSQVIGMAELPVEALRRKRDSSIMQIVLRCASGEFDGCISAGNTGAFAAAAQLKLGLLEGVSRSGIAVVIPSFHGPLTVCDVGANVSAKPHHLKDYGVMASAYAREVVGVKEPRVGLLSIGEEDAKGNELVKETWQMLKETEGIRFIGNVEGRALFSGECDVAVCDGFVGNVVLKLTEGLAEGLLQTIARDIAVQGPELAERFKPVVKALWDRHDYSEYGGAPLLGVNGVVIICHGRSDRRAIRNAVRVVCEFVTRDVNAKFVECLATSQR